MRISDWSSDVCSSDLIDSATASQVTAPASTSVCISGRSVGCRRKGEKRMRACCGGYGALATHPAQVVTSGSPGDDEWHCVPARPRRRLKLRRGAVLPRSEERRVGKECVSYVST